MTALRALDKRLCCVLTRAQDWGPFGAWWAVLPVAIVLMLAGMVVLAAIGGQLGAMHRALDAAPHLDRAFHGPNVPAVVTTWHAFFDATAKRLYRSPLAVSELGLRVDTFAFVPGYTVAALLILVRSHGRERFARLRATVRWTALLTVVVVVLDLSENVLEWHLVHASWTRPARKAGVEDHVLSVISLLKWWSAVFVILPLVLLLVVMIHDSTMRVWPTIRLLRGQIVATLLGVVVFVLPIQLPDVILRWNAQQVAIAVGLAILFSAGTWAGAWMLILNSRSTGSPPSPNAWRWVGGGSAVTAALVAVAATNGGALLSRIAPVVPLALFAVVFLLGLPVKAAGGLDPPAARPQSVARDGVVVARLLGSVMFAVIGLTALHATIAAYVAKDSVALALGAGIGLACAALVAPLVWRGVEQTEGSGVAVGLLIMSAVGTGGAVGWLLARTSAAVTAGSVAVVLAFVSATSLILGAAVFVARHWVSSYGVPPALRAAGARGIPVLTLLLIWGVVAAAVDDGSHWAVRTVGTGGARPVALADAFHAWTAGAAGRAPAPPSDKQRTAIPMVLVASSGGGIRAAYWTALAMDCLFSGQAASEHSGPSPCGPAAPRAAPADVFVASGISGGSLGLVEWDAHRGTVGDGDWARRRLGGDFVTASLAQGLLAEVPRSFLHFATRGRAEVTEDEWTRAWDDTHPNPMEEGFLAGQAARAATGGPLLMVNGSSVFDGCALNVSVLDVGSTTTRKQDDVPVGDCMSVKRYLDRLKGPPTADTPGPLPATADIVDYLGCSGAKDVSRSTAALLSSRFTYVSPAGRIQACNGHRSATKFIVDGGYVDTSAAESLIALWQAIEPMVEDYNRATSTSCIVPYFVQLDNTYLPSGSPQDKSAPPNQLLAPAQALLATTGLASRAERARAFAADLFTSPLDTVDGADGKPIVDRYVRIAPMSHPGTEAPLGWTLAPGSRRDLETQLYDGDKDQIAKVRTWLTEAHTCAPGDARPSAGQPP